MDSLVGYGSDDELESGRHNHQSSGGGARRREDDTNYDDVNMDMSEESQGAESEPELPPAEPLRSRQPRPDRGASDEGRAHERSRSSERRDKRRDRERHEREHERERDREHAPRSPRRDERPARRARGLLGDRPDDHKVPALMDLKPYGDAPVAPRSQDARDAVSPRFAEHRDRREREREREQRHGRRADDGRPPRTRRAEPRPRSRSRGAAPPPPPHLSAAGDRRGSPSAGDYRPSSYKVNKKLEVMEKMGLQIKTPDGSMATARQLRAAAGDAPPCALPSYYGPGAVSSGKILDQVQKRKLLWSNKEKGAAEAEAAKWSGARFAQDSDGKQVSKFMRLMGIKDPAAVRAESADATQDPNRKQEELFQAMQAQYEVARATTHTMRGVGLGFQRGNF